MEHLQQSLFNNYHKGALFDTHLFNLLEKTNEKPNRAVKINYDSHFVRFVLLEGERGGEQWSTCVIRADAQ